MRGIPKSRFRTRLLISLTTLHLIVLSAIWYRPGWSWGAASFALALYSISSLAVTVGYHRYWTHGAFECNRSVQYVLAFCAALAGEGPITHWRRDHRQHHAFTDEDGDPHSPWRFPQPLGFLWAHIGWLLWDPVPPAGYRPSARQDDDRVIRWQERWYWPIVVVPGFVLPLLLWGWTGLWLAGFVRLTANLHFTWAVNSVAHVWGTHPTGPDGRPWTADQSRNNVVVAAVTMGEGWHGNHHVKQNCADLGREHWWDPGRVAIRWMEDRGWAWNVTWTADA